jgi:hypothetical protein
MKVSFVSRAIPAIVLSIVLLVLAGCTPGADSGGNKLDGVYHSPGGGPITITLKEGKATVLMGIESKTLDYKVDGTKLTIVNPQEGDLVLNINDDGTLNSELGVFSKKP